MQAALSNQGEIQYMTDARLRLKPGSDRRLRGGHLWVYSNEVDVAATPLTTLEPGSAVVIEDHRGVALGAATVSPNSLICARLYSRTSGQPLDQPLLADLLRSAMQRREAIYSNRFYRLCYGDADGIPGLVVDRYGDYLAVQLTTIAMDKRRDLVVETLLNLLQPRGILFRNLGPFRAMEGLPETVEIGWGEVPQTIELVENDTRFEAPLLNGQKTGWFYDHRENRALMQRLCRGQSVLDVFSYIGGWGIQALSSGAESACCVDASREALDLAARNAQMNGFGDRFSSIRGKAADVLKELASQKKQFDIVVLDPPAFIKRRKDIRQGEKAYHQINQLALKVLSPGGLLVSASCSLHLTEDMLVDVVRVAAAKAGRRMQIIARGGQGMDHPVHPSIPETAYLKAVFVRDI